MNFLAHLHIAHHCESDLVGNLLGDFVKGDPYISYPQSVADGIKLHRFVDSYTDKHSVMKQAKTHFPYELKRFAPIALDLFWDHCLTEHWTEYHKQTLNHFCSYAEQKTLAIDYPVPEKFVMVNKRIWQGQWFHSYRKFSNLEHALYRISSRSPRLESLALCFDTLNENYRELLSLFPDLYDDILKAAQVHAVAQQNR